MYKKIKTVVNRKIKSKKFIPNARFWNQLTNEEVLVALALVTSPDQIITVEDLRKVEIYFKDNKITPKIFKDDLKNANDDIENEALSNPVALVTQTNDLDLRS